MRKTGLLFLFLLNFSFAAFARNMQEEPHLIVHYWANKGSPFGHVAMDVKDGAGQHVYLSYAMRNDMARDAEKLGPSQKLKLPLLHPNSFSQYQEWIQTGLYWERNPKYGQDYQLFTHNCAHAIADGLDFLGYKTGLARRFALRPSEVWHKANQFKRKLNRTLKSMSSRSTDSLTNSFNSPMLNDTTASNITWSEVVKVWNLN